MSKIAQELRGQSAEDLQKEIAKLNVELFQVKIKIQTGQEKDTAKAVKIRKRIACAKTLLAQQAASGVEKSAEKQAVVRQPKNQRKRKMFRGKKKRF